MTGDNSAECARLLGEGKRPAEAARLAGVQESTRRKAIYRQGGPQLPEVEADQPTSGRRKSERRRADAEAAAGMGTAGTRAEERIQAAMGLATGATTRFEAGHDVALAGLHRIGGLTYRKNVKDVWPESEFQQQQVILPEGGRTRLPLALRETRLGVGEDGLPVTEVRRRTPTGHQTAVITTARHLGNTVIAGRLFARWCQENFFAYRMDTLLLMGFSDTARKRFPAPWRSSTPSWRDLDNAVRQTRQKESKLQPKLATWALGEGTEIQPNAESVEALQAVQAELEPLRVPRKATPRKVTIDSLPEAKRPTNGDR